MALLIGPEGGLADEELTAARGHGFDVLQLGPRVLRTETAPVVALSALGAHWGDIPALADAIKALQPQQSATGLLIMLRPDPLKPARGGVQIVTVRGEWKISKAC